jgi:pimeloyl-ACP methyl ester carboxylesterase
MKTTLLRNDCDNYQIPTVLFEAAYSERSMVLFHGLTTNKLEYLNFYKGVGEELSSNGINVISIDSRTHGESHSSKEELTITNMVSDGIETIKWSRKKYGVDKVDLFGTSFGAITAICLAQVIPQWINRIYLLAPVLDLDQLYLNPSNPDRAKKYDGLCTKTLENGEFFEINERQAFSRSLITEFSLISLENLMQKSQLTFDVMHGTEDSMVPFNISSEICHGLSNVNFHEFKDMDHGFTDINDENGISKETKNNLTKIYSILKNESV